MKPTLTIAASNKDRFQIGSPATDLFVKSIQWQTNTDFELLIADGGSKNYEEIKEYFAAHEGPVSMRIVQHKIEDVFLRAFLNNVGVRNAYGEYIMTTDVDMMFGKEFVNTLMDNVGPNNMVESRTLYWKYPVARMVYNGVLDPYNNLDACRAGRIKKRTSAGGCQCMHIDSWTKVRGFDERFYGWGSEDYDLLGRCSRAKMKIKWMGEAPSSVMLFHQPHAKDVKRDLGFQKKNLKLLNAVNKGTVNPETWGGQP